MVELTLDGAVDDVDPLAVEPVQSRHCLGVEGIDANHHAIQLRVDGDQRDQVAQVSGGYLVLQGPQVRVAVLCRLPADDQARRYEVAYGGADLIDATGKRDVENLLTATAASSRLMSGMPAPLRRASDQG